MKFYRIPVCRIILACMLFAAAPLWAQQSAGNPLITDEQIVVLPKEVYVGDQMEIRYTFATAIDLSTDETRLPLKLTAPEMEELTILSMTLSEADSSGANGYVLSIQCIPWKSGIIDIPPIDEHLTLELDVPPISIQSILAHTGNQELRTIKPPILIPGTTWIIWFIVLAVIALGGGILFFLGQLRKRGLTIAQFWYLIVSTPSFRRAMRMLRRLAKKSTLYDDQQFAQTVTKCIRRYLTERFLFDFEAVSSSDTLTVFDDITAGSQSSTVLGYMEILEQILVRMDYVRFSGATDESALLKPEERQTIISALREAVRCLEKDEEEDITDAAV